MKVLWTIVKVALAMVLLVGAGLTINSLMRLENSRLASISRM